MYFYDFNILSFSLIRRFFDNRKPVKGIEVRAAELAIALKGIESGFALR